ncbi:HAD family phosphatase [Planctomonas sp. JC2975]|uniref:HAD family hydrolase n=1 Tax=Planctomonas sp. JC2975 TaxID=2729626 RepID=UPI001475A9E5|nr:HAD family phosphatase [Planctomonas sp. JC2975]NNC13137.1 HAD family phosphatase [Planctomonas sp. JC2975]
MPISLPDRVVIFDYGEVISLSPSEADRQALIEVAGVDPDAFWPSYWGHRDGLDQGTVSIHDYWRRIEADTHAQWSESTLHLLWVTDFRGWLSVDPGTIDVLVDLRDGGTRLALLSNAGADFGSYFRQGLIGSLFERVFVSGELLLVKPDAAIFRHALDELGIDAAHAVFIDNKPENVEGAEAIGITGHVFTGPADLRAFLTALEG